MIARTLKYDSHVCYQMKGPFVTLPLCAPGTLVVKRTPSGGGRGPKGVEMAEKKRARSIKVVAASMAMVVVGSGAAFAATIPGTDAGEVLYGTRQVDKIYGYGGADLVYGYAGADSLYGGNEAGWGDRIQGGPGGDRMLG